MSLVVVSRDHVDYGWCDVCGPKPHITIVKEYPAKYSSLCIRCFYNKFPFGVVASEEKEKQIMDFEILESDKSLEENVGLAIGYASMCWDENRVFETSKANKIVDELVRYIKSKTETVPSGDTVLKDLLETAWGIIANASNGDWTKESPEWQHAAIRFRDSYFKIG